MTDWAVWAADWVMSAAMAIDFVRRVDRPEYASAHNRNRRRLRSIVANGWSAVRVNRCRQSPTIAVLRAAMASGDGWLRMNMQLNCDEQRFSGSHGARVTCIDIDGACGSYSGGECRWV